MTTETFAVIAGGGTAGHVLPAVAIGRALVERGHPQSAIHFVGSSRGIEADLVPEAGFPLTLLPGRGIQRRLTLANIAAAWGLVRGLARSLVLVRRLRPRVLVAMGGYASVGCALAAAVWRVPIVVAEQNAVPGAANRLVARFARAAAVSFPGTPLPRAVVTGNPVRSEVLAVADAGDAARQDAQRAMGIEAGRSLLLVFGGSLGALRINRAVLAALECWRDCSELAVHHIVGARDWDTIRAESPELTGAAVDYRAVRYEHDMPRALVAADLAVCRSGSSTCFELAAVGVPAVLVPSPHVTGDHQTANARQFADAGAAVLVPDVDLDGDRLATEVGGLLGDPTRLAALRAAARRLARPDAAEQVAGLVEEHARA
ncbi:MAG: undecaprenyldiphospho-muramoylpentapeptide beta-N-acetylglucosaminyltransferase [Acidimicrobiales bacterium]